MGTHQAFFGSSFMGYLIVNIYSINVSIQIRIFLHYIYSMNFYIFLCMLDNSIFTALFLSFSIIRTVCRFATLLNFKLILPYSELMLYINVLTIFFILFSFVLAGSNCKLDKDTIYMFPVLFLIYLFIYF